LAGNFGDQELSCEIARVAKVDQTVVERMDERCHSLFYRLMKVFMRGSIEQSVAVTGMGHFDADSMVEFMQRVISGAASEGNSVIVGHGAPFLLRGRPDTFHVFVYAPFEEKAAGYARPARAKNKRGKKSRTWTGSA
jgi:hypothetical protein